MNSQTRRLLDVRTGISVETDEHFLDTSSETGTVGYSLRRLTGGLSDGVQLIDLHNGRLVVTVIPTRGMSVLQVLDGETRIGWDSPVSQVVHPAFVDASRRNHIGWLDGFNELICRCGLSWNGAPGVDDCGTPLGLHGRVANLPAHTLDVTVSAEGVELTGWVEESTLFGPRLQLKSTLRLETASSRIQIEDEVSNLGAQPAEVELLYHTNIGSPVLEAGARCVGPVKRVIPRDARAAEGVAQWDQYEAPQAGFAEQAYFLEMAADADGQSGVLLHNHAANLGVSVEYDTRNLPCFTLWKNTMALEEGYVTGLEPGTDLPNHRSFERQAGRLRVLAGQETLQTRLELAIHRGSDEVTVCRERLLGGSSERSPELLSEPDPQTAPAD